MKYVILLFAMMFFHIVDDYYLQVQGMLAQMKQKKWWKEHAPDELYKNDYIMALAEHAFSWSFMIHIPIFVFVCLCGVSVTWHEVVVLSVILNTVIHAYIDHKKANLLQINLVEDQLLHLGQILLTWLTYCLIAIK